MTTDEAVRHMATAFERAEDAAREIKDDFRAFRKPIEAIRNSGDIGGLEAQALAAEADALATQFEADLYAMHARWTKRAQDLNIDLPSLRSGGR